MVPKPLTTVVTKLSLTGAWVCQARRSGLNSLKGMKEEVASTSIAVLQTGTVAKVGFGWISNALAGSRTAGPQ